MTLEICSGSVQSAINAQAAGAQRVELCEGLVLGGTTPSYGTIALTRKNLSIDVNVLIRPRSGDFLYTDVEFETIKEDIRMVKQLGCNGVVCGILHADGSIDVERTRELVELARPLSFTFHRAFDRASDPVKALEDVIATGADRILTSGQQAKAIDGAPLLKQLVEQANGRIIIMPGSGVNAGNIAELMKTGATEFHCSGQQPFASKMAFVREEVPMSSPLPDENLIFESNVQVIKEVVRNMQS
ncbi:copper homeostasis protein CutC [Acetobacteroides hydrogenigenes]|uniref:PF03932 family protein CutC n=1 Tax=Acetobacteroides hydrogenigenes TaxID=979970 RepID=A0A4V2RPQ3_9BACT|nr:copper homeostasis protein CutC [Acetobacteroides hydrogenigenes]TCN68470.1 copper homeostasis protein [Acetobacteroides hydrogenigenes]